MLKDTLKVNNKCMKDYDPTKPSKCISYFDMNNLYGWAMSSYLPYGGFKWLKKVENFDVTSISKKRPIIVRKLILNILKNYMY